MKSLCLCLLLAACDDHAANNSDLSMMPEDLSMPGGDLAQPIDLAGADLAGLDLASADLSSGDLSSADFAPVSGSATYVFLPNVTGNFVDCRLLDVGTGAATAIDENPGSPGVQSTVAAGTNPLTAVASPNGKFLFVPNEGEDSISAYKIDAPTGRLTRVDVDPGTVGVQDISTGSSSNPFFAVVDSTSTHLFAGLYSKDKVAAFSIDGTTGALTPFASPSPAPVMPRAMAMDSTGSFLFVVGESPAVVAVYSVSGGTLTQVDQDSGTVGVQNFTTVDNGPLFAVAHPTKRILYVVANQGGKVDTLSYTSGGVLSALDSDTVAAQPMSAAVDPTGKYLYAASYNTTTLSGFSIGADGSLTAIADTTVTTNSRAVFFEPSGAMLFVLHDGGSLQSFHLNLADGSLTAGMTTTTMANGIYKPGIVHVSF